MEKKLLKKQHLLRGAAQRWLWSCPCSSFLEGIVNDFLPVASMTTGTGQQKLCALGKLSLSRSAVVVFKQSAWLQLQGGCTNLEEPPDVIYVGCNILGANNPSKPVWFPQRSQQELFLTSAILCPASILLWSGRKESCSQESLWNLKIFGN